MLTLNTTLTGYTRSDLLLALEQIKNHVENGMNSAHDKTSDGSGSYQLELTGSEILSPELFQEEIDNDPSFFEELEKVDLVLGATFVFNAETLLFSYQNIDSLNEKDSKHLLPIDTDLAYLHEYDQEDTEQLILNLKGKAEFESFAKDNLELISRYAVKKNWI